LPVCPIGKNRKLLRGVFFIMGGHIALKTYVARAVATPCPTLLGARRPEIYDGDENLLDVSAKII
jgi:hypothetical protein